MMTQFVKYSTYITDVSLPFFEPYQGQSENDMKLAVGQALALLAIFFNSA